MTIPAAETIADHLIREKYITGSRSSGAVTDCAECGEKKMLKGRGLCGTCYQRARRGGYLSSYPRSEVYDYEWCEDVLAEMIQAHGAVKIQELVDDLADLAAIGDTVGVRLPKR